MLATASAAGALPGLSGSNTPTVRAPADSTTNIPTTPQEVEEALGAVTGDERETRRQLERLGVEAKRTTARTIAYGRAYVRKARAGLLPVGGGFEKLVDHATDLERLRRIASRSLDRQRRLQERRAALSKQLDALRARRAQLEVQRQTLARAQTALMAAQDRSMAFQRAFSSSGPATGHTAIYGSGVGPSDPVELAAGFAAMKGRLPFPLPGRTEVVSASRPGADGPGLEMRAPAGSPVRSVYPGRVAFADEYAEYGKTVIVDHGGRYYTVSANLARVGVQVGDELPAGSRLGTVGEAPGRPPGLYFEIRYGAQTVDPAPWFGI
jgi:septal ring factor EnvC (AmiA/AmiB activator)